MATPVGIRGKTSQRLIVSTVPSSLELRSLIQTHGGEYHLYYEHGRTTYTVSCVAVDDECYTVIQIASDLATAKRSKTRKDERFVLPEYIVDS